MIFLNIASSAAALVFYLPGVCTHADTKGIQTEKYQSPQYSKFFGKNTIFNEHPVAFTEYRTEFLLLFGTMKIAFTDHRSYNSFRMPCIIFLASF